MWIPSAYKEQQSSFVTPVTPPTTAPLDPPCVCIQFNQDWLPYVMGALTQLVQPRTWDVATQGELQDILNRATALLSTVGTSVACGSSPPALPGIGLDQRSCNVAGYLAEMVIREAMRRGISAIQQNQTVLGYGLTIIRAIPGAGILINAIMLGLYNLYQAISAGPLSDYQNAALDDSLWGAVTCAIYLAIRDQGQVTQGNFSTLQSNVHALAYPHTDVQDAIDSFISDAGYGGLQAMQPTGALAEYDCTNCGRGSSSGPKWLPTTQDGGALDLLIAIGQTVADVALAFDRTFASPPLLTVGSDNPDVIVSVTDVTTTGCNVHVTSAVPTQAALPAHVDWVALLPGPS